MARSRHNITLDDDVWRKAGKVLDKVGISRSKFIEITLRGLSRSEDTVYKDVIFDLHRELLESAKMESELEKERDKLK